MVASKKIAAHAGEVGVRVRMYRVGFGDFFLLTVPSDDGPQHILIDCGVTPGTTHKGDIGTIKDAVAHMAEETGHHLALIIVTHRHMDHIIGFSRSQEIFEKIKVDAIWMPYWESEYDEQAQSFQAELTAVASDVQQHLALAAGSDVDTDEMLGMLRNATGIDHEEVFAAAGGSAPKAKTGKGGGSNARSLDLLKNGLGVKPEYYAKGDKAKIPSVLKKAGLTAEILGPPPKDELDFMKLTDLKKGVGQYLGASTDPGSGKTFAPFGPAWRCDASSFQESAFREFGPRGDAPKPPFGHEALEAALRSAQPAALFTAVKSLDSFLNNQSLVVLFTFEEKKLLFVGDAQAGNWEYWMYGGTPEKAPSIENLTSEGKGILANLDFYKVGHHGSTNSTPVTAVEAMGGKFASMCSTQEDSYGNVLKGTEVPRNPLIDALGQKSATIRSDYLPVTIAGNAVPAISSAPEKLPKPKQGRFVAGDIYCDYFL